MKINMSLFCLLTFLFGFVSCYEEFEVDPVNYGLSLDENTVREISINEIEGTWNPIRITPYSQITDFSLNSFKIHIKDKATFCNLGQYSFKCYGKPWSCNESCLSIDLIDNMHKETVKLSIDKIAVHNYRSNGELEIEFLIPAISDEDNLEDIPVSSLYEGYNQIRVIFQK